MRPNSFATFILFDDCFVAITATVEIEMAAGDAGGFRVYNLMTLSGLLARSGLS